MADSRRDRTQEFAACNGVRHREELFELVDDQHHLGSAVGKAVIQCTAQPLVGGLQRCSGRSGPRCGSELQECACQLVHRSCAAGPSQHRETRHLHVTGVPDRLGPRRICPTRTVRRPRRSVIAWSRYAAVRPTGTGRRSRVRRLRRMRPDPCTGCGQPIASARIGPRSEVSVADRKATTRSPTVANRSAGSGAVAPLDHGVEFRWQVRAYRCEFGHGTATLAFDDVGQRRPAWKRCLPREQLEQHGTQRIDVRSRRRLPQAFLGTRPRRRSDSRPRRTRPRTGVQGDPEVAQVGVAQLVEQDVRRPHVPMDHPPRVPSPSALPMCSTSLATRSTDRLPCDSTRCRALPPSRYRMTGSAPPGSRQ